MRTTKENVIEKFKSVHMNKFDYSKFNYITIKTKSIIICKEHGEFLQHANAHLNGNGCPKCVGKFPESDKLIEFIGSSKKNS